MDEDVEKAKGMIVRLSDMLRYQLYETDKSQVFLQQEINHLQNFIELQKNRASEKLQLKTAFYLHSHNPSIVPFLFLPLVENAFKYVGGDYVLNILLKLENQRLYFEVYNSKSPHHTSQSTGGIGLQNLEKRLQNLYPEKHTFDIKETAKDYQVTLILQIEP
jgi:two-component system, LytTR family, sensor kinase